jgi:hypothetical protein
MDNKKRFGISFSALLLIVALMLPAAVQFAHTFEGHNHVACNDQTTHFHETVTKCGICDFHLASFNYKIAEYPEFVVVVIPSEVINELSSVRFHSFKITNTQLRGPPYIFS